MHRRVASSVLVVAILAAVGIGTAASGAGAAVSSTPRAAANGSAAPADRVLIVALPNISWRDLEGLALPNLERLFRESALADMTNRVIGKRDLAAAYLTIGAGTRAASTGLPEDGQGLEARERFGPLSASETFQIRTDQTKSSGIVQLGIASITQKNDEQDVDVTVGALGDALARGGFDRAVIGNGDGLQTDSDVTSYRRFQVNALMGSGGAVPAGRVDDTLLEPDDSFPFGLRADLDATVDAFRDAWLPRSVVLVEASDLARLGDFAPLASSAQRKELLRESLRRTDDLVGRLVAETDPARDAVLVLGVAPSSAGDPLTVAALRAPGVEPGFLRSASTRRTGFVLLADVAPTVVDLVGLPRDKDMSGSPFAVRSTSKDATQRRHYLVDSSKAGKFRDSVRGAVVITFTVIQGLLGIAAFLVLRRRGGERARAAVRFAALATLGFVPTVYLARLFSFQNRGYVAFGFALGIGAIAFAFLFTLIARRVTYGPIMAALAAIVALQIGDVLLGARLQFGSAFGYSPTIGVRVAGLGNISYAFLASAAILLSGLVAHWIRGWRGVYLAIGLLALTLVIDIAPFWGSDFGGILSMVPAFGVIVTAVLLLGIRIHLRVRTVIIAGLATFAVLVVAAAVDLSRPVSERTHVGRLIDSISENGASKLFSVVGRKLDQNITTLTNSDWRPVIPIVLLMVGYLLFSERKWIARIVTCIPELRAALIGFAVLAVLGYALNDSGIAIPAVMLTVLNATLIWLVMTNEVQRESGPVVEARSSDAPALTRA